MNISRDTRIINVPTALSERVAYLWRWKEEGKGEGEGGGGRRREKVEGEGGGGMRREKEEVGERGLRERIGKGEEGGKEREGRTQTHQEKSTVTIVCTTQLRNPHDEHNPECIQWPPNWKDPHPQDYTSNTTMYIQLSHTSPKQYSTVRYTGYHSILKYATQDTTVFYSILQHTTVFYSTLQHTTVHHYSIYYITLIHTHG